jgi:hypothetical protein
VNAVEYSRKNSNLSIDNEDIYVGYRAALAAISADRGVIHVRIQQRAVNAEDYITYLRSVRRKMGRTPILLFMD